ncbi:MAG: hypothetical protein AVDCRST_MAG06-27, partial [uncultured Nocardioides sp.]
GALDRLEAVGGLADDGDAVERPAPSRAPRGTRDGRPRRPHAGRTSARRSRGHLLESGDGVVQGERGGAAGRGRPGRLARAGRRAAAPGAAPAPPRAHQDRSPGTEM